MKGCMEGCDGSEGWAEGCEELGSNLWRDWRAGDRKEMYGRCGWAGR